MCLQAPKRTRQFAKDFISATQLLLQAPKPTRCFAKHLFTLVNHYRDGCYQFHFVPNPIANHRVSFKGLTFLIIIISIQ